MFGTLKFAQYTTWCATTLPPLTKCTLQKFEGHHQAGENDRVQCNDICKLEVIKLYLFMSAEAGKDKHSTVAWLEPYRSPDDI